jgi:hypothetical protein
MKKVTIGLFAVALSLSGCAIAFRVAEAGASIPAAIVYPLATIVGKPCPDATNMWEGTAGSPCTAHVPDSKAGWGPSIPETCTPVSPAATYAARCASCHDNPGRAPDLTASTTARWATRGELSSLLHDGRPEKGMPSFAGRLTSCQVDALTRYIRGR